MDIKKADFNDLNEILDLQRLCYKESAIRYNDYKIQPIIQTIDQIRKEFEKQIFLKICDNSKIIGSVRAYSEDDTCYIGKLIVHPSYQNRGFGRQLMNEIEKIFNRVRRFELFTGFKDEKNLYFYQKIGYKIFKEKPITDNLKLVFLEKPNSTI